MEVYFPYKREPGVVSPGLQCAPRSSTSIPAPGFSVLVQMAALALVGMSAFHHQGEARHKRAMALPSRGTVSHNIAP